MSENRGRRFGSVRQLPSGKWQARYRGPDGRSYTARTPDDRPLTFATARLAGKWLDRVSGDVQRGTWQAPGSVLPPVTFGRYSAAWLADRDLAASTRRLYSQSLRLHLLPTFGGVPVTEITPAAVRAWHASLATGPTAKAHAYSLLKTIMATAVTDELLAANPCRLRAAGSVKRAKVIRPATLPELDVIVATMPERLRMFVLLAAWLGLRRGELTELRRSDVDLAAGVVRVRRSVVGGVVKAPKTAAGSRDVAIPPHLLPELREHLRVHTQRGPDGLLFPGAGGGHIASETLERPWYRARAAAGRPDLTVHGLRHTGATLAAATGATLSELMARIGHATPDMALRYQHASQDRDRVIADMLSDIANGGNVVPFRRRTTAPDRSAIDWPDIDERPMPGR